mmetsp:Transcript_32212/g.68592  ORF Transcript_32212/g.68592 Transcript_32212/m.68592 type:complete len:263 (+) Transcript_32212:2076-2864(+)
MAALLAHLFRRVHWPPKIRLLLLTRSSSSIQTGIHSPLHSTFCHCWRRAFLVVPGQPLQQSLAMFFPQPVPALCGNGVDTAPRGWRGGRHLAQHGVLRRVLRGDAHGTMQRAIGPSRLLWGGLVRPTSFGMGLAFPVLVTNADIILVIVIIIVVAVQNVGTPCDVPPPLLLQFLPSPPLLFPPPPITHCFLGTLAVRLPRTPTSNGARGGGRLRRGEEGVGVLQPIFVQRNFSAGWQGHSRALSHRGVAFGGIVLENPLSRE